MFAPLACFGGSGCDPASSRRQHQERKLHMLSYWRDGVERQLAAVNAAISTLEKQMARDVGQDQG
ncbi:MAG: sigma factor SigF [Cyanobium sp. CZS 48M]|nr:sigma factor SigF [Cyanobium sp. CZS48M]